MSDRGGYRQGSGAKPAWKHGKTKVIRVPEVFADEVLKIARTLDDDGFFEIETSSKVLDLSGVSLKTFSGKTFVSLESLVLLGYELKPDALAENVIAELYKSQILGNF
jgi:hypothetical protein